MTSSAPGSRSGSPRSGGGGGPGLGLVGGGSVSLTPLSPAAPSTSTAAAGAVFSALPSCLMPEVFTGEGDFEDYFQQFTTAAALSGWQLATSDNRPQYFALRLKGNALHFYTTLTVAQQQNFGQLVAAFCTIYTTNFEVLKAKLKAARQQPNQTIAAFLCDVLKLAWRVYRGQPLIEEQMVPTSFIEGLHDAQLRWELRKSKPANPDAALALAVELHAFMEVDPSLRIGSQATVNKVSATPPQPLMTTASTSQEDMMGTLIQTIRQEIQKALPQTNPNSSNSRSNNTDGRSVRFNISDQIDQVQIQAKTKTKTTETQTSTIDTITIRSTDTRTVEINKTTDLIRIAILETSNKTEITQTNNHAGLATEQITSPEIVKLVLTADDWDKCLANAEHHDKIKTTDNKTQTRTKTIKTYEIIIKTATQIPFSNKIL